MIFFAFRFFCVSHKSQWPTVGRSTFYVTYAYLSDIWTSASITHLSLSRWDLYVVSLVRLAVRNVTQFWLNQQLMSTDMYNVDLDCVLWFVHHNPTSSPLHHASIWDSHLVLLYDIHVWTRIWSTLLLESYMTTSVISK